MNTMRIAGRLASIAAKSLVASIAPFAGSRVSRAQWESQYEQGHWDRLRHVDELPHYWTIAGYLAHFAGVCRVLDVGCGEGILQEALGRGRYSRYLGIDLAAGAIAKAASKADAATLFECADALHYAPSGSFDAIVFNEVLYYFDAPLQLLSRYAGHLAPGGVTIVSMATNRRSSRIWKMLDKDMLADGRRLAGEVLVGNRTAAWVIKVYRGVQPEADDAGRVAGLNAGR